MFAEREEPSAGVCSTTNCCLCGRGRLEGRYVLSLDVSYRYCLVQEARFSGKEKLVDLLTDSGFIGGLETGGAVKASPAFLRCLPNSEAAWRMWPSLERQRKNP